MVSTKPPLAQTSKIGERIVHNGGVQMAQAPVQNLSGFVLTLEIGSTLGIFRTERYKPVCRPLAYISHQTNSDFF